MEAFVDELHAEIARLAAEVRARCQWRPVDWGIARWKALDVLPVIAARLVLVEHLARRREAQAVALAGWRAWMTVLRELCEIWRSVLPSRFPCSGRALPVEAIGRMIRQLKC